jgi:hypothetical protein
MIWALVLGLGLWLWTRLFGFRGQRLAPHRDQAPRFDPKRDLAGKILCEGIVYGPFGRVVSRFVAQMEGRWQGDRATLTEVFRYDSGRIQHRAWDLRLEGWQITALAEDLIGPGRGEIAGNAVRMRYKIRLAREAGGHVLDVEDWMYLLENGTIMNRSQFRKFGIKLGELIATMRQEAP